MEIWLILCKFSIIVYILLKYFIDENINPVNLVLYILIYICIEMVYYLFNNKLLKRYTKILSIAFVIAMYFYVNKSFLLLIPLDFYEFGFDLFPAGFRFAILAFSSLFVDKTVVSEYLLISTITYLLFIITYRSNKRIQDFKDENYDLRKKIDELYKRIDINEAYEAQVKYTVQLEERNKISQKIHDSVGHTISGCLMQLEAAKIIIDKNKDDAIMMIQNSINVLREGLESIRAVLRDIKPPEEQMGINRLRLLMENFMARSNVEAVLKVNGNVNKITYVYWNVIIENTKELLTNVIKYANATKVYANIDVLNKFIKIEIKDNGVGAKSIKEGLGLKGIEERTTNVGGKVIIDGSNGFSVISLLPRGDS